MLTANRQILLVMVSLAIAAGQSIVFSVLPPLGREVGLDEIQITGLVSLSALVFTLCSPKWGRLSDRVGRKPLMLLGLAGYSIGSLLFALAFEAGMHGLVAGSALFALVVITRLCQSSLMAATPASLMAYVTDNTPVELRAKILARVSTGNNLGTIIGPVVAGLIAVFGLTMPLYFSSVFTLAALVAIWLVIEPRPPIHKRDSKPTARLSPLDPRIRSYLLIGTGFFVCFAMIQQTLAFSVQDQFNLSGKETAQFAGGALMCLALSSLVAQSLVLQLLRFSPNSAILIGLIATLVGYLLLLAATGMWLYAAAMLCVGFGLGMAMPNIAAAAANAVDATQQGAVAGFTSAIPATGFAIGPITGGVMYHYDAMLPQQFGTLLSALLLTYFLSRLFFRRLSAVK